MTPDTLKTSGNSTGRSHQDPCEACGASDGSSLMLEIPVPVAVLENLGLSISPQHSTRMLCEACFAKSLQGGKLDLLDLVQLAPDQVKQSLHAYLAHEFEI